MALRLLKDERVDCYSVLVIWPMARRLGRVLRNAQAGALVVAGNHDRWFLEEKVRHVEGAHFRHLVKLALWLLSRHYSPERSAPCQAS